MRSCLDYFLAFLLDSLPISLTLSLHSQYMYWVRAESGDSGPGSRQWTSLFCTCLHPNRSLGHHCFRVSMHCAFQRSWCTWTNVVILCELLPFLKFVTDPWCLVFRRTPFENIPFRDFAVVLLHTRGQWVLCLFYCPCPNPMWFFSTWVAIQSWIIDGIGGQVKDFFLFNAAISKAHHNYRKMDNLKIFEGQ